MRGGTLSIVVPVFNEERRLPALLEQLDAEADTTVSPAGLRLVEVIVVDDGSVDRTASILEESEHLDGRLRVIRFEANRGKGAAVRAGALGAVGQRVLMTDVDLSTPLAEVLRLSAELDRGIDFAMGSRSLPDSRVLIHQPAHRELAGKVFNLLFRLTTGLPWRDTQCGFKLFDLETTRRLFEVQRIEGFAYDAELCVNARRLGLRVVEVPVRWVNNTDTRVTLFGSSVRMALDLAKTVWRARRPLDASSSAPSESSAALVDRTEVESSQEVGSNR
jgi:dolichyl-phosphate beta-glucosyltransferase